MNQALQAGLMVTVQMLTAIAFMLLTACNDSGGPAAPVVATPVAQPGLVSPTATPKQTASPTPTPAPTPAPTASPTPTPSPVTLTIYSKERTDVSFTYTGYCTTFNGKAYCWDDGLQVENGDVPLSYFNIETNVTTGFTECNGPCNESDFMLEPKYVQTIAAGAGGSPLSVDLFSGHSDQALTSPWDIFATQSVADEECQAFDTKVVCQGTGWCIDDSTICPEFTIDLTQSTY